MVVLSPRHVVIKQNEFGKEFIDLLAFRLKLLLGCLGEKNLKRERPSQNGVPHNIIEEPLIILSLGLDALNTVFYSL